MSVFGLEPGIGYRSLGEVRMGVTFAGGLSPIFEESVDQVQKSGPSGNDLMEVCRFL